MKAKARNLSRRHFLYVSAALASGGLPSAAQSPVLDIGGEPQLFFDDWIVDHAQGLKRTMHKPEKKGLIKEADGRAMRTVKNSRTHSPLCWMSFATRPVHPV